MKTTAEIFEGKFVGIDGGPLVVECTDIPLHHWKMNVDGFEVVVHVNQAGFEPSIKRRNGLLFLGAEQGAFVIDIRNNAIVTQIDNLRNVQWIDDGAEDGLVFAAEDDVVMFDNGGKIIWRENLPDVIQFTEIKGTLLHIVDFAGDNYRMNILDGSSYISD